MLTKGDKLKGRSQKRALGADPPAGGSRPAIETISIRDSVTGCDAFT